MGLGPLLEAPWVDFVGERYDSGEGDSGWGVDGVDSKDDSDCDSMEISDWDCDATTASRDGGN